MKINRVQKNQMDPKLFFLKCKKFTIIELLSSNRIHLKNPELFLLLKYEQPITFYLLLFFDDFISHLLESEKTNKINF
jgi:hypothetical protein